MKVCLNLQIVAIFSKCCGQCHDPCDMAPDFSDLTIRVRVEVGTGLTLLKRTINQAWTIISSSSYMVEINSDPGITDGF